MKPWYWPVTTTVYKLVLGFVLVVGVTTLLDEFGFSRVIQAILSGLIAGALYLSLWKMDWL